MSFPEIQPDKECFIAQIKECFTSNLLLTMRQEQQLRAGLGFAHLEMGTFRFQFPRIPYVQKDRELLVFPKEEMGQTFLKDELF